MARTRIYYKWDIPGSVVIIVNAVLADYARREKIIRDANASEAVLKKAVELNAIVDKALEDIEPGIRREIIRDISLGRGYNKSNCCVLMQNETYYRRRRKLVHDIAVSLSLINSDNSHQ